MRSFATLLHLARAVASMIVPQEPVAITRNNSESMISCDDGWEGLGLRFKLGYVVGISCDRGCTAHMLFSSQSSSRFNRSQCAVAELAWTKTVSKSRSRYRYHNSHLLINVVRHRSLPPGV